ncbi:MAG: PilC/PilY family type IV pilus protein [Rhodocyclaceae bacterium]|nr:PilC/PilY family type IV pilus protein [Rhodocyclaceae bacterium]
MKRLIALTTALFLILLAQASHAGTLSISNEPLGSGTGVSVKPNLWFILDDSGSMSSTYTPDYVNDSICQQNMATFGSVYGCGVGDPPYMAAAFNRSFYNPQIRYDPPKKADGSAYGNASPTQAPTEPFLQPSPTSQTGTCYGSSVYSGTGYCNLTTKFPHVSWCTDSGKTICAENATATPYPYPNGTYQYSYKKTFDGAPYYYVMSGAPAWCSGTNLATCTGTRWSSANPYPKFSGAAAVAGVAAKTTIQVNKAGSTLSGFSGNVSAVTYNSTTQLISASIPVTGKDGIANRNKLAADIAAAITAAGWVASQTVTETSSCGCKPVVQLIAPPGSDAAANVLGVNNTQYNNKTLTVTDSSSYITFTIANNGRMAGGVNKSDAVSTVTFTRVDIVSATTSYTKYANRIDCTGSSCTYTEELQNFANWYSYYRSRMLMMKSATSLAFSTVTDTNPGSGFRVGFSVISMGSTDPLSGFSDLKIADFGTSQKSSFYTKLFAIYPHSWTPNRHALARAGKLFGGEIYTGADDPVQFSCQQNFAFLATDGYWNINIENPQNGPFGLSGASVGDRDGSAVRPYYDAAAASNTLADIARYYYMTDLRPTLANDVPKGTDDELLSGNTAMHQHMVTFTMGLGVDGLMGYDSNYTIGGSSDYNAILSGTGGSWSGAPNWPNPITDSGASRIDDLWHAAVNAHGRYYSAADPTEVADSINQALASAEARTGSAAAAATSNLEPVAGDNFAYVASYTTKDWDGNLDAKTIDLTSGALSAANVWSARDPLDTLAAAGGRTLYTYDTTKAAAVDKKKVLNWSGLTSAERAYFAVTQLAECSPISNCPGATDENLFDFLMGKADATTNKSYRERTHVLGDIVSSQPVFVRNPVMSYSDSGYEGFKNGTARPGMVYVGANDGFLHAFDADTGAEKWAFMPSQVMPYLYQLANKNYSHRYYTDGQITVGDVDAGGWKTILVAGLNAGGKQYFAMDVTDPLAPKLLWEFTDADMGYSYGNPLITKLSNGQWAVLVTSGYNNGGGGQGHLYVLDAGTGTLISKIATASGSASATNPIGLAKINNWVEDVMTNNTTQYVYGGDLNGDMWRFDLSGNSVSLLASIGLPVTTKPELAEVDHKKVVFGGTGLFLQVVDKSNQTTQVIFGIKDDNTGWVGGVIGNSDFVQRNLLTSGDYRTTDSSADIDWDVKKGWYMQLPDAGERVNVDPKIQLGTLVVASNVPQDTGANSCSVGGYAWLNYIDYATGGFIDNEQSNPNNYVSTRITSALAVGINVVRLPDGKLVSITTTSDNQHPVSEVPIGSSGTRARRVSWRELTNN